MKGIELVKVVKEDPIVLSDGTIIEHGVKVLITSPP